MKKNYKTLVIAEAGVNHNGKLTLAKRLIDVAIKGGANIVKFQTFKTNKLKTHSKVKIHFLYLNLACDLKLSVALKESFSF